jgi:hypothetical protein
MLIRKPEEDNSEDLDIDGRILGLVFKIWRENVD